MRQLFALLLVTTPTWAFAQNSFQKYYPLSGDNEAHSVIETFDNGYMMAGVTNTFGAGQLDVFLMKLDSLGSVEWMKTYGGNDDEGTFAPEGVSVTQTSDSGFVFMISSMSFTSTGDDAYVVKVDQLGNVLWDLLYWNNSNDRIRQLIEEPSGALFGFGTINTQIIGASDALLVKFHGNGAVQWTSVRGAHHNDHFTYGQRIPGGNYIIGGESQSFGPGSRSGMITKMDSSGVPIWDYAYGGSSQEKIRDVLQRSDGGIIAVGQTNTWGSGWDAWILATDSNGTVQWSNAYGGSGTEHAYEILELPNGDFLVAGHTTTTGGNGQDLFWMRIDDSGNLIWTKTLGGTGNEDIITNKAMMLDQDGSLVITGFTDIFGNTGMDPFLLKIGTGGSQLCNDVTFNVTTANVTRVDPTLSVATDGEYIDPATQTSTVTVADSSICACNPSGSSYSVVSDTTICFGDTASLSASGGSIYNWSPAATLSDPNVSNPDAFPDTTTLYTVMIDGGGDCGHVDSVLVTVQALPETQLDVDTVLCVGDTIVLDAGGGFAQYVWSNGMGTQTIVVSETAGTYQYYVDVFDAIGCSTRSDTARVAFNEVLAQAGTDTTICIGDSAALFATGGTVYSWTPAASLSGAGTANPIAFPSDSTTYTVVVSDSVGCRDTAQVTVDVFPVFPYVVGPTAEICAGDTTQIVVLGGLYHSWSPSAGLSDTTVSAPLAFPSTTTMYTVSISDDCYTFIDSVLVTVHALPVVDAGPDTSLCFGDSIQLSGSGGPTYTWSPGIILSDSLIANPVASPQLPTTFTLSVTDGNNCNSSDSVHVFVSHLVTAVIDDTIICRGDTGQLWATGGSTYLWQPNLFISDPTSSNPLVYPTFATTYIVTITDDYDCVEVDTVEVTVATVPVAQVNPDSTLICEGDTVQLTASGGDTYAWNPAVGLSDPGAANPLAFPTTTTQYTVEVVNAFGCTDEAAVEVVVSPISLQTSPGATICIGDTVQLWAAGTGLTNFLWQPATGLSSNTSQTPLAFPSATTMYTVSVWNGDSCTLIDSVQVIVNENPHDAGVDTLICQGDTVQLWAYGGDNYAWIPSGSLSDSAVDNPLAFPDVTTQYVVHITGTCINSYDTVLVLVQPPPVANAGPDVSICNGDSTQLAASGGSSFVWSPDSSLSDPNIGDPWASPTITTEYILKTTDALGCESHDSVIVAVEILDVMTSNDTTICLRDSAHLWASGGPFYDWSPSAGLSNISIPNPVASPAVTTTYTVTVSDSNDCQTLDSVKITVIQAPIIAWPDTSILPGDTAYLHATGGVSYTWSPPTGLSDPNSPDPLAFPDSSTCYSVEGVTAEGCVGFDTVCVSVRPLMGVTGPKASFVHIYPNPTEATLFIQFNSNMDDVALQVFDLQGRLLQQLELGLQPRHSHVRLDWEEFNEGFYVVHVTSPGGTVTQAIIVH